MMHRKDRLDMAIKSAKTHLEGEHDNIVTKKEIYIGAIVTDCKQNCYFSGEIHRDVELSIRQYCKN